MIEIKKLKTSVGYASNTYLLTVDGECAVIDPSAPFSEAELGGKKLKYILLTHGHFDHFLEIDSWVENTGATVVVSQKDRPALKDSHTNCYALFMYRDKGYYGDAKEVSEGDILTLGDEQIQVSEYPGHTVGSVVYTVGKHAFVGDIAFAGGGYGRFDLPGGDMHSLVRSLRRILSLEGDIRLYPGHGEGTTVNEYRKHIQI